MAASWISSAQKGHVFTGTYLTLARTPRIVMMPGEPYRPKELWGIDTPTEPQKFPLLSISLDPINRSQCAAAWASDRLRSSSNMYLSSTMWRAAASNRRR